MGDLRDKSRIRVPTLDLRWMEDIWHHLGTLSTPKAPSYLISKLQGYVAIEYIGPRTHYLSNWSPRVL